MSSRCGSACRTLFDAFCMLAVRALPNVLYSVLRGEGCDEIEGETFTIGR